MNLQNLETEILAFSRFLSDQGIADLPDSLIYRYLLERDTPKKKVTNKDVTQFLQEHRQEQLKSLV